MLKSLPFPDELSLGHLYRLIRLNDKCFADPSTNQSTLLDWLSSRRSQTTPPHRRKAPTSIMVADCIGIGASTYRYHHCMGILDKKWRHLTTTEPAVDAKLGSFALPTFSRWAPGNSRPYRLCRLCRQDDLLAYGMTYWHRIHQVPGMDICPYHLTPLQHHTENEVINNPNPSALDGPLVTDDLVQAAQHPVLERYRALAALVLGFGEGIELHEARAQVRKLASTRGVITGAAWNDPKTSQLANYLTNKKLPTAWLGHYVGAVAHTEPNQPKATYLTDYEQELRHLPDIQLFHPGYLLLVMAAMFTTHDAAKILLGYNPETALDSLGLGRASATHALFSEDVIPSLG